MNELKDEILAKGTLCIVTTDNCSRFFKGDTIEIIRYIRANGKYLAKRAEGQIEGEIKPEDIRVEERV